MTQYPTDLTTHPSLLLRVRDGADHQAWSEFVTTYGPMIYSYCRKRGLQECDAADISQEVLTRVSVAMRGFEYQREKGRFRAWLGTITFREIARQAKRRQDTPIVAHQTDTLPDIADASATSDWDEHFQSSLLQMALERIRGEFELSTWQAFTGVWLQMETADLVAQRLGIGIEKVYVAKSRVLKRLRAEVLTLCEDSPLP